MDSLPELAGGRIRYRLPLTEVAAIGLADVLLADSGQERAERLEAAWLATRRWRFGRFSWPPNRPMLPHRSSRWSRGLRRESHGF